MSSCGCREITLVEFVWVFLTKWGLVDRGWHKKHPRQCKKTVKEDEPQPSQQVYNCVCKVTLHFPFGSYL